MILWLIVAILALLFSAFFSASETAVFSIPREKINLLKNEGKSGLKIYQVLVQSDLFLVLILLGNNFVNIVAISSLGKVFGIFFNNSLTIIFVLTTVLLLVFGEIMPKTIAVKNSMLISRTVAGIYVLALEKLGGFLKKINSLNLKLLRMNYRYLLQTPDPFVTNEEYAVAIKEAVSNKKFSESTGKMITGFIDLTGHGISNIARNRNSLKVLKSTDEKALLSEDEIGILYINNEVKKVFYRSFDGAAIEIEPAWFPCTKTVGDLHDYFLKNDTVCVLLVDEYGGFDGAASRYDIYKYWKVYCSASKNVFGEIIVRGEESAIKYRDWIAQDMLEKHSEIKTVNGVLCAEFGGIPQTGQTFSENGFVYHIINADKTKINKIKIQKTYFCK
ncbi:MAG: CNNM domain-containing protein [Chitinispirillales bacterium]|jgi:CBS domain containing-hemolysin-like protein|nr:CNNM domain-containing protein [Chitinispirillales bacterium]